MRNLFLLLSALLFTGTSFSQDIVSMTYIGSKSQAEINNLIGMPISRCGVKYYKMTYTSVDAKGDEDVLSGLVVLPDVEDAVYPVLMYHHGTSDCKTCVPSRYGSAGGDEGEAGVIFSSMAYATLIPDNVGMGDGNGFQTYVHASSNARSSEDMLIAFRNWAEESEEVLINDQLFITGYSQGGYNGMAFHKYMQEEYGAETVTAATHNSGSYSLSVVMRNLILSNDVYYSVAYLPLTVLGFNEYYEEYDNMDEFFKEPYVENIDEYYAGNISLSQLNNRIIDSLIVHHGAPVSRYMIKDDVVLDVENDDNHILNQILRENDLFNWVPESPTRLFYCEGDDQVPYTNATSTIDSMYGLGADHALVQAENLGSTLDHTGCVAPAFLQTVMFFAEFQNTTLSVSDMDVESVKIYPNPVKDQLFISGVEHQNASISIWDMSGRELVSNQKLNVDNGIDVSYFKNGLYVAQVKLDNGNTKMLKFVVSK